MIRLLILSAILIYNMSYGQEYSDTLSFEASTEVIKVTIPDSLKGRIIYTIENPTSYVVQGFENSNYKYFIAIKTLTGFASYGINFGDYSNAYITGIDRCNLDKKGNDELMIKWDYTTGNNGALSGWSESASGNIIWNLDIARFINLITS